MSEPSKPIHLGDGLYASFDGYQIKLRANDPNDPDSDTVFVDLNCYMALVEFGLKCWPPEKEDQ